VEDNIDLGLYVKRLREEIAKKLEEGAPGPDGSGRLGKDLSILAQVTG